VGVCHLSRVLKGVSNSGKEFWMKKLRLVFAALLVVVLLTISVTSVATAAQPSKEAMCDVTKTTRGAKWAREAAERWQQMGVDCDSKNINIYKLQDGSYLAAPRSAEISMEYVEMEDGSMQLEPVVATGSDPLLIESNSSEMRLDGQYVTSEGEYWSLVDNNAFARFQDGKGWMDHAFKKYKLVGETVADKDYYTLEHYATAKSKGTWTLARAHIWCQKRDGSSEMEWVDWDPTSDKSGGSGNTITIGISFIVELTDSFTFCDKWNMTKYAEAGRFKNTWEGLAWRSERSVAYMICVSVPQGGYPLWSLSAQYTCC
jgi:hypothetical protein